MQCTAALVLISFLLPPQDKPGPIAGVKWNSPAWNGPAKDAPKILRKFVTAPDGNSSDTMHVYLEWKGNRLVGIKGFWDDAFKNRTTFEEFAVPPKKEAGRWSGTIKIENFVKDAYQEQVRIKFEDGKVVEAVGTVWVNGQKRPVEDLRKEKKLAPALQTTLDGISKALAKIMTE
jgi:hypothetical protein